MSADKISAPYAIFYTKLGKNLQKFFHWRTLRKSPARSHNKRFFLVSHCGVGGNLRSKPPKGRSPSMEARTTGPLNGSPPCGAPQWEPALRGRRKFAKQTAEGAKPLNGSPPCGAPQWEPALRGRREFAKQTAVGAKPLNGSPPCGTSKPKNNPSLRKMAAVFKSP